MNFSMLLHAMKEWVLYQIVLPRAVLIFLKKRENGSSVIGLQYEIDKHHVPSCKAKINDLSRRAAPQQQVRTFVHYPLMSLRGNFITRDLGSMFPESLVACI